MRTVKVFMILCIVFIGHDTIAAQEVKVSDPWKNYLQGKNMPNRLSPANGSLEKSEDIQKNPFQDLSMMKVMDKYLVEKDENPINPWGYSNKKAFRENSVGGKVWYFLTDSFAYNFYTQGVRGSNVGAKFELYSLSLFLMDNESEEKFEKLISFLGLKDESKEEIQKFFQIKIPEIKTAGIAFGDPKCVGCCTAIDGVTVNCNPNNFEVAPEILKQISEPKDNVSIIGEVQGEFPWKVESLPISGSFEFLNSNGQKTATEYFAIKAKTSRLPGYNFNIVADLNDDWQIVIMPYAKKDNLYSHMQWNTLREEFYKDTTDMWLILPNFSFNNYVSLDKEIVLPWYQKPRDLNVDSFGTSYAKDVFKMNYKGFFLGSKYQEEESQVKDNKELSEKIKGQKFLVMNEYFSFMILYKKIPVTIGLVDFVK